MIIIENSVGLLKEESTATILVGVALIETLYSFIVLSINAERTKTRILLILFSSIYRNTIN